MSGATAAFVVQLDWCHNLSLWKKLHGMAVLYSCVFRLLQQLCWWLVLSSSQAVHVAPECTASWAKQRMRFQRKFAPWNPLHGKHLCCLLSRSCECAAARLQPFVATCNSAKRGAVSA
jgi:hypothetical protein